MQAIIIALIGAVSLVLPSLLSAGVGNARTLKRIKEEAEAFTAIPEELVLERQLARTALSRSIWDYALSRRGWPRRWANMFNATLGLLVFSVGITFAFGDGLDQWADPWVGLWSGSSIDLLTRIFGGALALVAIYGMLRAFWNVIVGPLGWAKYDVDGLSDSLAEGEQLLALHAKKLSQYDSVGDLPLGPWITSSKPSMKEIAKWHFTPWTPFDDVVTTYGSTSDSADEPAASGRQDRPEPCLESGDAVAEVPRIEDLEQ